MENWVDGNYPLDRAELDEMVTVQIQRAYTRLAISAKSILKKTSGLSINQFRLIVFIESRGESTVVEFIKFSGLDKSTASRCVSDLTAVDYISAEPSKTDRRVQVLRVTAKGRESLNKSKPMMDQRRRALQGCLSDTERKQLFSMLSRLMEVSEETQRALHNKNE